MFILARKGFNECALRCLVSRVVSSFRYGSGLTDSSPFFLAEKESLASEICSELQVVVCRDRSLSI